MISTFDPKIVPFKRKAGIELTWHSPKTARRRSEYCCFVQDEADSALATILNLYFSKKGKTVYNEVYNDPGCVEIPSPVLNSWKELDDFWNYWEDICANRFLMERYPVEASTGGGGHIHIDCTGWEQIKICREIASRPYLSWVFLHPSDDINALTMASYMKQYDGREMPMWMQQGLTEEYWESKNYDYDYDYGQYTKTFVVCCTSTEGLEFRAFTGAFDLQEQREHMAFVQAYTDYCINKPVVDVPWKNKTQADSYLTKWKNYDKCEIEFLDLILTLGLDPKVYLKYPQTWLKARFEAGMGKFI